MGHLKITSTVTPDGDIMISIWHEDSSITPILIDKEEFKAYRLFREGEGFRAEELLPPQNSHRRLRQAQESQ